MKIFDEKEFKDSTEARRIAHGIMEAASNLLTNHSLVSKAIELISFKPEGDSNAVSAMTFEELLMIQ